MIKGNKTLCGSDITDLPYASRKIVIKVCDTCFSESEVKFSDINRARAKRKSTKDSCKSCAFIPYRGEGNVSKRDEVRKKISKATLGKGKTFDSEDKLNPSISHKKIDGGYVRIYDLETKQYIQEHRYVVEKSLGIKLKSTQFVHHIDGNKLNNKIENLQVAESVAEHNFMHSSLEAVAFELVQKNVIKFDKDTGLYYYNSSGETK